MADAGTPKGGPVERLDLLGAIIDDDRTRLIHIKVGRHILKRYYAKFGNARASVSFLQEATSLTRGSVAQATEDLVAWGYFTRIMGSGKRPTEYHPNFSVLSSQDATSVLQPQDDRNSSVRSPQDDRVLPPQDAKSDSVLQLQEQTHLRSAATHAATVNDTSAAPGTAAGLTAAPARASDVEVEIVATEVENEDDERWLTLTLQQASGEIEQFGICVESYDLEAQDRGQLRLTKLLKAVGIDTIEHGAELHGKRFLLTVEDGFEQLAA